MTIDWVKIIGIRRELPKVNVGDYLYRVNFNKVNFHIDKLKVIDTFKKEEKNSLSFINEYEFVKLEDNTEVKLNDIDLMMRYNNCRVFTSLDKCKKFIKLYVDTELFHAKQRLIDAKANLEFWEKKQKVYERK